MFISPKPAIYKTLCFDSLVVGFWMTAVCISKLRIIQFISSCWIWRPHRSLRWKKDCFYNLVVLCIPVCVLHMFNQVPIKKQIKILLNLIHKFCTIFGPQNIAKSFPLSNTIVHIFQIKISFCFSVYFTNITSHIAMSSTRCTSLSPWSNLSSISESH